MTAVLLSLKSLRQSAPVFSQMSRVQMLTMSLMNYGADIVKAVTDRAFDMCADKVLVDAQNYAVPFYEKLGFKVIGAEITDRGLPHIPMSRQ